MTVNVIRTGNIHTVTTVVVITGVALIAKFCVNIAFLGAVRILATSPCHHTQNDWTSIHQVMDHWWLPRHSTLDQFAKSVWSQPWLRTLPQHHKSSQWRAESGRNKRAKWAAVILVCMAIPPSPNHWSMRVIVGSALCLWIKFGCTLIYLNRILTNPYLEE